MSDDEKKWLKFNYAWKWFEYHASQRLIAFRFYLIIIGAAGWLFLRGDTSLVYPHNLLFGLALFIVSLFFFLLEVRNNRLVNCGRQALDKLEEEAGFLGTPYAIRHNDEKSKRFCVSHYFVIRTIYIIVGIIGFILIGMGFCR
ncbi:MAG: hypothetical protein ISS45_03105 [Candidatus Omnitrophica bacterium]|nr:hypothetical protein [Candidatus Omnitrophota bacterium]